jgi:ubiquinone/menaquinone biosynthesis C-methylase UbiE
MAEECAGVRVFGEKRTIDYARTMAFFEARAGVAAANSLTATMYQDPVLASRRDHAEKQTALPQLRSRDRVLDLGCGSGRWAEVIAPAVSAYLGIDFSSGLLEVARARAPEAVFQQMHIDAVHADTLALPAPFSLVVCSGILAYVNDSDVLRLFSTISRIAATHSRIYVREPVAKAQRLTLDSCWSEELEAYYSAVYRTRSEYFDLFSALEGFYVYRECEPFPRELQNRTETEQRCFFLCRTLNTQ